MKKIILVVTDSLGVGELPDAEKYGDKRADTFGHIAESLKYLICLNWAWGILTAYAAADWLKLSL